MKWSTAVGHVQRLAEQCTVMADRAGDSPLPNVRELWVYGEILGPPRDLTWVSAAAGVDLPPDEVPWLCRPPGTDLWSDLTRASKNPVALLWRSVYAPVWNHHIDRPVLVWDAADGLRSHAFDALRGGRGGSVRADGPTPEEYEARMDEELRISLAELVRRTREYETEHTTRLGVRADALHDAARGYLDVLAARPRSPEVDDD